MTFILIWFKNVSGNGSDLRRSYAWLMEHKRRRILIKINKLLEAADWNLFSDRHVPKNIRLEESATITKSQLDAFRMISKRPSLALQLQSMRSRTQSNVSTAARSHLPFVPYEISSMPLSSAEKSAASSTSGSLLNLSITLCYRATDRRAQPGFNKGRMLNNRNFRQV